MIEWILIITMHTPAQDGSTTGLSTEILGGFSSEKLCRESGAAVAEMISSQWLNHAAASVSDKHQSGPDPLIFHDCQEVRK
jgi:hypothetical protein